MVEAGAGMVEVGAITEEAAEAGPARDPGPVPSESFVQFLSTLGTRQR